MSYRSAAYASAFLGVFAVAATAAPQELYGIRFSDVTPLYRINQANGGNAVIGSTGLDSLGDLTSDTRAGSERLWAIRIASNELVRLDPATGGVTGLVPLTFPGLTFGPGQMTSLAFDPVSGDLYGNTSTSFGALFDALYKIDPNTGICNFVGGIGTPVGAESDVFALGFTQTGRLYGIADVTKHLLAINHNTGNAAVVGTMQLNSSFDIASRPDDDVMFLADSGSSRLWTLDTATANVTDVGPYAPEVPNIVGLAFSPVPEPATIALISLATGVGLLTRRRRA